MTEKPAKFKQARMIVSVLAVTLTLGVAWEIYKGVAIEKTGGPTYRAIHPGWYWFDIAFHGSITAVFVWLAYRAWRSRKEPE